MNLRRKKPHDSLYMLLDTMCDAFGGIILLAVLVVLLTGEERNHAASSPQAQEPLRGRLALAQTDLQQSLQLSNSLQSRIDSSGWQKQIALLDSRKVLRDQIQKTREAIARGGKELDAAGALDPSERFKAIDAELTAAQAAKEDAQNRLAAAQNETKQLHQQRAGLEERVIAKLSELQRPLRLPREHHTTKRVSYYIVRYGRVYRCHNPDLSRNETELKWSPPQMDDETVEPIRGKGIDPANEAQFLSYIKDESKDETYIAFCVFEDSFPTFIRARQLAVAAGYSYGWEPFRIADGPVTFSNHGHAPSPQ